MACNAITSKKNDEKTKEAGSLPVNPFRSLLVHFGMLLGVDDFETIDGYHRGKMRLHNVWLHRQGTVWGLKVTYDKKREQIKVSPGLAVDGLGRELYLDTPLCLDISAWYEEHKDDPKVLAAIAAAQEEAGGESEDGSVRFDTHVVIRFKACLGRQVPALTETCDNSGASTASSRVFETVELLLKPGKASEAQTPTEILPYHRLRLLFGLEEPILIENEDENEGDTIHPADQEVLDTRKGILALAPEEQPAKWLVAFRHLSALDQMDLGPAEGEEGDPLPLFPAQDPALVPLADLTGITLSSAEIDGDFVVDEEVVVDNTVRPVHLPTSTIQELLCGPGCSGSGTAEEPTPVEDPPEEETAPDDAPPDAGGPRIDPDSVSGLGEKITFKVSNSTLLKASVRPEGLSITSFDLRDGWSMEEIDSVSYDKQSKEVTIQLRDAPAGTLIRLIVKGTGRTPFLGRNRIPLAGAVDGPPGSAMNGNDFVHMFKEKK